MLLYGILSSYLLAIAVALSSTVTEEPQPTPSTIVDILSSDVQYSYFLRGLQLNGLIPLLNELQNVTILAPVNSAFAGANEEKVNDVTNSWLRYIINQKVRMGYLGKQDAVFQTLYDQGKSNYTLKVSPNMNTFEYVVDDIASVVETDIYAKHQHSFIQAIDQLLPIKPDICSILLDDNANILNNQSILFVKNAFKSLFCEFESAKTVSFPDTFDKEKISERCESMFKDKSTIFIPSDSYVNDSLSSLSQRYYLALTHHQRDFAITKEAFNEIKSDINNFFTSIIVNEFIGGENGTHNRTYKSLNKNSKFNINLDGNGAIDINNNIKSSVNASNIVLSDGIIHVFDSQDSSNFFSELGIETVDMGIPKKALFALHFSNYVKDLEYHSLNKLIDTSSGNRSFLISLSQRDDIQDETDMLMSFGYKQNLLYHVSDQLINIDDSNIENHHILFDSKLCSKKRIGSCFKIKLSTVTQNGEKRTRINDDASVVWDPIILPNNTAIYVTDKDISSPGSFRSELVSLLSKSLDFAGIDRDVCLKTIEYINEFDLFSLDENGKGYTIFLPCAKSRKRGYNSDPWSSLGLVLKHLKSNPKLFKRVFNGLFVESLVYSNSLIEDEMRSVNLNGEPVIIKQIESDSNINVFKINDTLLDFSITSDYLFNQGVIQIIDEVLLPDDFEVSFLDLIKTTFNSKLGTTILDIIEKVPHLSEELGIYKNDVSPFSILVPKANNIQNLELIRLKDFSDFMSLHLIPNTQLGKLFNCLNEEVDSLSNITSSYIIETNHTNSVLVCHKSSQDEIILNLVSKRVLEKEQALSFNKDHEVKITTHGCTSHSIHSNESCVFLIDKPMKLSWLEQKSDFLHIHIGFISVGIGMIFGLFIFGALLCSLMFYARKPDKVQRNVLNRRDSPRLHNSTFMRVTNNEDSYAHDRGYETDIDVQNDGDYLLPIHGAKQHNLNYGTMDNNSRLKSGQFNTSNPRGIGAKNIPNVLNKYKNLPPT